MMMKWILSALLLHVVVSGQEWPTSSEMTTTEAMSTAEQTTTAAEAMSTAEQTTTAAEATSTAEETNIAEQTTTAAEATSTAEETNIAEQTTTAETTTTAEETNIAEQTTTAAEATSTAEETTTAEATSTAETTTTAEETTTAQDTTTAAAKTTTAYSVSTTGAAKSGVASCLVGHGAANCLDINNAVEIEIPDNDGETNYYCYCVLDTKSGTFSHGYFQQALDTCVAGQVFHLGNPMVDNYCCDTDKCVAGPRNVTSCLLGGYSQICGDRNVLTPTAIPPNNGDNFCTCFYDSTIGDYGSGYVQGPMHTCKDGRVHMLNTLVEDMYCCDTNNCVPEIKGRKK